MTRGARTRSAALLAAAVLLTGLGAAGCGDDSGGADTPEKTPSAQAPESTPAEEPGDDADADSGGAGGGEPADPAAAEQEIEENWTTFFSPDSNADQKLEVLEDGEQMRPLMTAFADDERWKQVNATVKSVEFNSAEEAEVTYDISLEGETVVPDASGVSVLQDDTWKVSKRAICSLIELSGSPAPGC